MNIRSPILAAVLAVGSLAANAAVVYDNGAPDRTNGYNLGGTVGLGGSVTTADDFTLGTTSSIQSVAFFFNNYNGTTGWDNAISYAIRADAGGNFGAVLATGSGQNVTQVGGGYAWCCGAQNSELVTFDLVSTFVANAGQTYWLELGGAGGPTPWWVTTGSQTGNTGESSGGHVGVDFAFSLHSTGSGATIPEPASLALVGLSIFGVAASRRRAK